MRIILQRVSRASVTVDGQVVGAIGHGVLLLVGVGEGDDDSVAARMAAKVARLRIFPTDDRGFDRTVADVGGEALVVSQFTLHASTKKGNRPSFIRAARPETAIPLYEQFLALLEAELGKPVARGIFGADMKVALVNDGPVTVLMDSRQRE